MCPKYLSRSCPARNQQSCQLATEWQAICFLVHQPDHSKVQLRVTVLPPIEQRRNYPVLIPIWPQPNLTAMWPVRPCTQSTSLCQTRMCATIHDWETKSTHDDWGPRPTAVQRTTKSGRITYIRGSLLVQRRSERHLEIMGLTKYVGSEILGWRTNVN